MVEKILREARSRPPAPMVTEKSIRDGERFMAEMHRASEATLLSRIERGELITQDELVTRVGGNRRWVNNALKAGRVFSLQAPSGGGYFPSFFAESSYDRRALGRVSKVLPRLPGPGKYFFFISESLSLGMTPLQALAEGRVQEVLICAAGFAERLGRLVKGLALLPESKGLSQSQSLGVFYEQQTCSRRRCAICPGPGRLSTSQAPGSSSRRAAQTVDGCVQQPVLLTGVYAS